MNVPAVFRSGRRSAMLLLILLIGMLSAGQVLASSGPSVPRLHGLLADYAGAARLVGGQCPANLNCIDIATTIQQLKSANVDTYAYEIYDNGSTVPPYVSSKQDWTDLPAFLASAQAAGINVWVYLAPPSEESTHAYLPYGADKYCPDGNNCTDGTDSYFMWFTQIATLAQQYPNLQAIVMDDFGSNANSKFTTDYVKTLMDAAHAIDPALAFWPVLYYPYFVSTPLTDRYLDVIDGVIFPYRNQQVPPLPPPAASVDTSNTANSVSQIEAAYQIASDQVDLPSDNGKYTAYQLSFPSNTASSLGDYGQISQTVSFKTTNPTITFWVWDDYTGPYPDCLYKQLLLDGAVAWEEDVAGGDLGWHAVSVTLTGAVGPHQLVLRLAKGNGISDFGVDVRFDELQSSGITWVNPDFEDLTSTAWTFTQNSAAGDMPWSGHYASSMHHAYQITVPWNIAWSAGDYAQISEDVTFLSANPELTFNVWTDYSGTTTGCYQLQLWVDGTMVWSRDATGGNGVRQPVRISLQGSAGTHSLMFRVYETKAVTNFGLVTRFEAVDSSSIEIPNGYFLDNSGWVPGKQPVSSSSWDGRVISYYKNLPLVTMVYAAPLEGVAPAPDANYVNAVANNAIQLERTGVGDGVMLYAPPASDSANCSTSIPGCRYQTMQSLYGTWTPRPNPPSPPNPPSADAVISFPGSTASTVGSYGQLSQNISFDNSSSAYTVGFWVRDDYSGQTSGYHFKQLLLNGQVVWEEDVAGDEYLLDQGMVSAAGGWRYVYLDLTPQFKSLSAQGLSTAPIAFRVYDKRGVGNFGIGVHFGKIDASGFTVPTPGFEGSPLESGWSFQNTPNWSLSFD